MPTTKILIIEDEVKVAAFIKKGLEEYSYDAEIAYDGINGTKMASGGIYNLIILDINLPYLNGIEVCKRIRSFNKNLPVLMLTAMGTTEDKLMGFESGADDYLIKPFEFRELIARIKALLKRSEHNQTQNNILTVADLIINTEAKTVTRNEKIIELTAKEFALLEYFVLNKNRVLSRNEIAEKIWDLNFETGTNIIDVYVNFLRKKVDTGYKTKLIHTRIGMGYVLKDE
ncbi:MAG: DNA-binding response regulator [Bacteroidetes bacterium RIFOXYA12_FULL_35_11]|nr:MAG: DNA-binding response regulator [Bacteroidetes bacterium GWF2_35_48]OFY75267.1 MAG: DNA-binding response regulator [Bacteroidetes bacterium RIFOXYA12_FULL_35_11]OFY99345.1 MAG: DNA-binding response regulator [Bacteroidetes bacterium RIFOXYC12_FULL_35_7]HBX51019.1 DNA-binding response regulator [Bacteroidales bacterium]